MVLPTHDRPAWLAEALTSVLNGEFQDYEVIVSNNGDPQNTRRLQATIGDQRVRWVEQDPRLGPLENFLAGLSMARGEYVAVLHDDDKWSPLFLATLVPPLERHPEAVLAFADHYLIDADGVVDLTATEANSRRWGRTNLKQGLHQPFFGVVARQSIAITGSVFRRAALPAARFTPDVGPCYDVWVAYQLARTGGAAYYNPARLLYYRAHVASQSGAPSLAMPLSAAHCHGAMLKDPRLRPYEELLTRRLAADHLTAGARLLRLGARRPARVQLAASMRLAPTLKASGGWIASWVAPRSLLARL